MVGVSLDDLQVEFEGFSIKIDDQVCGLKHINLYKVTFEILASNLLNYIFQFLLLMSYITI